MSFSQVMAALLVLMVLTGTFINVSLGCPEKRLPFSRVKAHEDITVRCPNASSDKITFKLWHNEHLIATSSFPENQTKSQNSTDARVNLQVNLNKHEAHFVLTSAQVNWTGLYKCEAEILYPPPYKFLGKEQTVVIVEEDRCQWQGMRQCPPPGQTAPFWWAVACVILGFYCLIMSFIAVLLWHKLKIKRCLQNDYMNMKPGGFRKHPRVQHPVVMGRY